MIGDVFKDVNILEVSRKDALELLKSKSNDPFNFKIDKRNRRAVS